ncbi:MAG: 30S ribosomal protein S4 [Parcubacteria group bacterium GW2011_GWC2_39_14]|nr:MAG: 30S ribosomal protein S4 [Parcubacteria group bacterium GW2011_GWC2_39_14]KKR53295.1 MAG: 30S ribosomal protein S4 [Parcubacteria group bacterium GW2011_GWA2_40_23]
MGRPLDTKCKQCRREGVKLFLKGDRCGTSKCALTKRNYVPGMHGPKLGRGGRLSGYGLQLREKQNAKRTYRMLERQFRGYFDKVVKRPGDTGENLFKLLEMRLDNVVYRAGFATSRDGARQMVNHGHIRVNGKKVSIPSYQVKIKDKITIKDLSKGKELFNGLSEKLQTKEFVDWLIVEPKECVATVVDMPTLAKNKPGFDLKMIVEYYSR